MAHVPFDVVARREDLQRSVYSAAMSPTKSQDPEYFRNKTQLRMMYNNVSKLLGDISAEEVICRYLGKTTTRHARLTKEFDEAYDNLTQMAVMFNLMH